MMKKRILGIILTCIGFIFMTLFTVKVVTVNAEISKMENKLQYGTYVNEYDMSLIDINNLTNELITIENEILSNKITFIVNKEEYVFTLSEVGIITNREEVEKKILDYEASLDYYDKYNMVSRDEYKKQEYSFKYVLEEKYILEFLGELSKNTYKVPSAGKLVMNDKHELEYKDEVVGYSLDVNEALKILIKSFKDDKYENPIELPGTNSYTDDIYKQINKKISTFTTTFDPNVSRKYNLETASNDINGQILMPGDIFSYYNTAGPYNKSGYVYFMGVKGNGVCQVATTLYNAELLAGLETITRYSHPDLPKYIVGGLDAAVSTTKTFNADFKFKNTYNYPLYISAFIDNDKLTVEIWSNENATNGVTYKLRSERQAYCSYKTYREHYKDGNKIQDEFLGNSWYYTEVQ